MKTFLSLVANDLLQRFGTNMSNVTVVFPGKRASLFLNQELALASEKPVWTPRYITMSDLFYSLSPYIKADPIDSITSLYQIFSKNFLEEEMQEGYSLDKFWGWGEIILSDFDDVDKHMADANAIFSNVYELMQFESLDYLTDEQKSTLQHFFKNFSTEDNSVIKERFLNVWSKMNQMYTELRKEQMQTGTMYEGAIFRSVIENLKKDDSLLSSLLEKKQAIVFAGFNVLNDVEHDLMSAIQKQGKAIFYWDYDTYYVENLEHEAGIFMRQNLKDFPCALSKEHFNNLRLLQDATFISCNTDNAAARYTHQWLTMSHDPISNRNAVVMCNESLLQPVLHALPKQTGKVNVTMGFPLTDAPIYSFVMALIALQTDGFDLTQQRFRHPFVQVVQHHVYAPFVDERQWLIYKATDNVQLLTYLIDMVELVGLHFSKIKEPDVYEQLYIEAIFQTHRILNKFLQLINKEENPLVIQHITLRRLLRTLLCSTSIPFHGEPAHGLQVMGVLETRCLDFSHMLMLSVEEGMLPRNTQSNSMIPANIREAFGLTTPRHRIAVFSYYFYRLIQRTEHLTCVYNENCVGNSKHEMSRFLRQMLAETNIPIRTLWLRSETSLQDIQDLSVHKTSDIIKRMLQKYDINTSGKNAIPLSPSAINTYMTCPLKFFLTHVSGLRADVDPQEGLNAPLIGDIFHDAADLIYKCIIQRTENNIIQRSTLSELLADMDGLVGPLLDIVFDTIYFHPTDRWNRTEEAWKMVCRGTRPGNQYTGELIIIRRVLMQYLTNLLRYDLRHAPFRIIATETDRMFNVQCSICDVQLNVMTGGRIDRLDEQDGHIRVVDYKTGYHIPSIKSMDEVTNTAGKHEGYFLQAFLYAYAVLQNDKPERLLVPALFYPGKAYTEDYTPTLTINKEVIEDFTSLADEFYEGLTQVVKQIFSPDYNFTQTPEAKNCTNCDFKLLCGR
ncbi:MAG: PD-(D/E)XK nuclease family protein [Bacteroidaceae bacterium]|nr:PD-(D/E)XK nuclease family protein [Bacteroidaceae bacterium]